MTSVADRSSVIEVGESGLGVVEVHPSISDNVRMMMVTKGSLRYFLSIFCIIHDEITYPCVADRFFPAGGYSLK